MTFFGSEGDHFVDILTDVAHVVPVVSNAVVSKKVVLRAALGKLKNVLARASYSLIYFFLRHLVNILRTLFILPHLDIDLSLRSCPLLVSTLFEFYHLHEKTGSVPLTKFEPQEKLVSFLVVLVH